MEKVNIVLSGSAELYPALAGALLAIKQKYIIEEVVGTSGGSLVGAIHFCRPFHTKEELHKILCEINPGPLINSSLNIFSFWNLITKLGMDDGLKIEKALLKSLKTKRIPTGLNIVSRNILKKENVIFNSESSESLIEAIRASINLPIIFQPKRINGHHYVDGGIGANFFVDYKFKDPSLKTIGICFEPMSSLELPRSFLDYLSLLLENFIDATTDEHQNPNAVVIRLPLSSKLDFDLKADKINRLIEVGYERTMESIK